MEILASPLSSAAARETNHFANHDFLYGMRNVFIIDGEHHQLLGLTYTLGGITKGDSSSMFWQYPSSFIADHVLRTRPSKQDPSGPVLGQWQKVWIVEIRQ